MRIEILNSPECGSFSHFSYFHTYSQLQFLTKSKQPVQPEPRRIRHSIIRGRLAFEHPAYSLNNRTQPNRIPHFYIDLNNNPGTY
jgi:hypothetical protein